MPLPLEQIKVLPKRPEISLRNLTLAEVILITLHYYSCDLELVIKHSKVPALVIIRYSIFKLAKEFTFAGSEEIGESMNRSHCTVIAGLKAFDRTLQCNPEERKIFNDLRQATLEIAREKEKKQPRY